MLPTGWADPSGSFPRGRLPWMRLKTGATHRVVWPGPLVNQSPSLPRFMGTPVALGSKITRPVASTTKVSPGVGVPSVDPKTSVSVIGAP